MKNIPARRDIARPLLIASAVGLVCQTVYSQTVEDLSKTPFAKRPLHLQNTSTTTSAHGVKPNVMFFVDDSGSMQALVGGRTDTNLNNSWNRQLRDRDRSAWNAMVNANYANPIDEGCTFSAATAGTDSNCYYLNWPHWGFFRLRQQNNRIRVTIDALDAVVDKYGDDWRWNIYTLWGSESRASRGGRTPRGPNRYSWGPGAHNFMNAAEMKNLIKALSPSGGTPTTSRYVDVARIMRNNIEYRCQKSYIVLMSDGDANSAGLPSFESWERDLYGTFSNRTNPDSWGGGGRWETWTRTHNGATTTYQPYRAGAANGVSLFSQILFNTDLKGANDRVGTGPEGKDKEGGYWNENTDDADERFHNTEFTQQNIQTFVIGFGEGLSGNGENYLKDAATCEGNKEGKCFFKPNTGAELAAAFNVIAESIHNDNIPGALQTFSASTPATAGSTIAELAASLTLDTGKWSSQLLFAKFNSNGQLTNDTEHAGYANRRVLVNNGSNVYWLNNATPATRKVDFGIRSDNEFTQAFVPWLTRSAIADPQIVAAGDAIPDAQRTVKKYRERAVTANDASRQMADVIGASVVAMGKVAGTNKQKYIVTAANDGMAYIFSATGSSPQYNLALNYLPAGMQRQTALAASNPAALTVGRTIRVTAEADYGKNDVNNPHVFLNNGGLSWVRTPRTGGRNQQDILLGTMGQGGRGAYALTIAGKKRANTNPNAPAGLDTNPNQWHTEVPLWETDKSAGNALGYTISTGTIAQVATNLRDDGYPKIDQGVHLYAFIANGYETGDASVPYDAAPTLYAYDMMGQEFGRSITASSSSVTNGNAPGQLIRKISVNGSARGALSSPTLLDNNLDGIADFAYAGDSNGNLHRFDLRGAPNTWTSVKIFNGSVTQPITAAPAIHKIDRNNFVIIFGTGSDIYDVDRQNVDQQMVAGVYDDVSSTPLQAADIGDLLQQSIETSTINNPSSPDHGKRFRYLSTNAFLPSQHKGWYINLEPGQTTQNSNDVTTSERVVVKPQILLRTAFLTTRIYDFKEKKTTLPPQAQADNTCFTTGTETKTSGNSWQMAIDARTGSGPIAGSDSSSASGAYFSFSDNSASTSTDPNDPSNNRKVAAGFEYGYLASAPGLLNTGNSSGGGSGGGSGNDPGSGSGGGSSISSNDNWQINAHGELSTDGTIVSAFDTDPLSSSSGDPKCVDPVTGERNPLCDIKPECIPKNAKYSLLVATGGADSGKNHNAILVGLSGPECPDPLSKGNTLIRVDWREVPL